MPRRIYSNRQKLKFIEQVEARRESGQSLRSICVDLDIQPSQYRRWKSNKERLQNRAPNAGSLYAGRQSCLKGIEEDILQWFFELRERGMIISVRMVLLKASELDHTFRRQTNRSKDHAVRRFLKSHGLVHRAVTHESQRMPQQICEEAHDFILTMRPRVSSADRDQRFIINMDQTPVFFNMSSSTTLQQAGSRTVNGRTSTSSTMQVTVAVTVTASGEMLKPLIIFKGKPKGRIQREFPTYPEGSFYSCQDNAWMDEQVMKDWVETVLKPHVEQAPEDIHPILLLDSYRCHMMASIVNAIGDLGVQIEHIPGGCTGLCQPIDVGIGKPMKNRIRNSWEEWMVQEGVDAAISRPPSRQRLSSWIISSLQSIGPDIVQNSWRSGDYLYFLPAIINNQQAAPVDVNNGIEEI